MRASSLVLAFALALPSSVASADVVFGAACPPGSRCMPTHQGPFCEAWACTSDADCAGDGAPDHHVCRPLRVCAREHEVEVWDRFDGRSSTERTEMVVATCEVGTADAECAPPTWPEVPTIGTSVGALSCRDGSFCVRRALPSLPEVAPPPPIVVPAPVPVPVPAAPPATCGCHAGRAPIAPFAVLALLLLLALRRRSATALVLVLLVPASSHAQTLPPGFRAIPIDPPQVFAVTGIECTRTHAYVRNREGIVYVWDGSDAPWSRFPRPVVADPYADGESLAVRPDGQIFIDVAGAIYHWDHHRWSEVPRDPWFFGAPHRPVSVVALAADASGPWMIAGGALGMPADGTVRAFDVADAWWSLTGLTVFDASDVWVSGATGMLHWNGRAWSQEGPRHRLDGVRAFAPDDLWAWGGRVVLHWDGARWDDRSAGIGACAVEEMYTSPSDNTFELGGRSDVVVATTLDGVCRWETDRWARQMDRSALPSGGAFHAFHGACATDRHLIVAESGTALVMDLPR